MLPTPHTTDALHMLKISNKTVQVTKTTCSMPCACCKAVDYSSSIMARCATSWSTSPSSSWNLATRLCQSSGMELSPS